MAEDGGIKALNLRASGQRRNASSSTEGLKYARYFLLIFLGIFGSIFFNCTNYLSKRYPSISITAVLAFLMDVALVAACPSDLVFPLLVTVSCSLTLAQQPNRKLRQSIVFANILISLVIILSTEPSVQYSVPLLRQGGIEIAVVVAFFALAVSFLTTTRFVLNKISNFFLAGLLVACSVLLIKTVCLFPLFAPVTLPLLLYIRRSVRLVMRGPVTQEYASWTVVLVSLACYDQATTQPFVLFLCLTVGVLLGFASTAVTVERKQTAAPVGATDPMPLAAMTLTQRRKGPPVPGSDVSVEDEQVPTESGTATTSVSSSIVVIQRPTDVAISTAEIDSDEEEIFKRIAINP